MTDRVLDLEITGPEHTRSIALALAPLLAAGDVLILTGELGAGKTTFTRSLGEGLGVREGVISPTFVLSRVHPNLPDGPRPGGPDLVHVDAYRLASSMTSTWNTPLIGPLPLSNGAATKPNTSQNLFLIWNLPA